MAGLYIAAGINHFVQPRIYSRIIPHGLPNPLLIVYISGIAEILLGILLLFTATREIGAWGIILLLVFVFPANIQMMLDYKRKKSRYYWLTILRLPLQLVLIWWAWLYT
jgi:uncharacterized membrane protein